MIQRRDAVLTFLTNNDEILLAESDYRPDKKTWNGISGYIEKNEKTTQAAVRELYEEIKVTVYPHDLEQVASIHFKTHNPDGTMDETFVLTVFLCERWQGEPTATPGVRPQWFTMDSLPYDDMFEDTREWLPQVLEGEQVMVEVLSMLDPQTQLTKVKDVLVRKLF